MCVCETIGTVQQHVITRAAQLMGSHSASPNTAVLRTLSTVCATYELVTHVTHVTQATKIPVETKPSEVELLRVEPAR